jgi:hypothetical protein
MDAPNVIFLDIDGTLLYQPIDFIDVVSGKFIPALPCAVKQCMNWHKKGYIIILVTGRPETMRQITEKSLFEHGIIYDRMIMGLGPGKRYLINDKDPLYPDCDKAIAINIERNIGIDNINI